VPAALIEKHYLKAMVLPASISIEWRLRLFHFGQSYSGLGREPLAELLFLEPRR
jgi:hypothetical protein